MPCQVLAITWDGATAVEMEPYLSWCLQPTCPLVVCGGSATSDPVCHTHVAVWYWWKDSLVGERERVIFE